MSSKSKGPQGSKPKSPLVTTPGALVEYKGSMCYIYRGLNGTRPLFGADPGEYKYTDQTIRGISTNVNAPMLKVSRGGAYQITEMPAGLKIVPQGKPGHFEIIPTSKISFEEYQSLLNKIKYTKS